MVSVIWTGPDIDSYCISSKAYTSLLTSPQLLFVASSMDVDLSIDSLGSFSLLSFPWHLDITTRQQDSPPSLPTRCLMLWTSFLLSRHVGGGARSHWLLHRCGRRLWTSMGSTTPNLRYIPDICINARMVLYSFSWVMVLLNAQSASSRSKAIAFRKCS